MHQDLFKILLKKSQRESDRQKAKLQAIVRNQFNRGIAGVDNPLNDGTMYYKQQQPLLF